MSSSPPTFLAAHGVGLTLPGGRPLFRDLSLSLGSERTALVGPNGVGKSLLLEILVGLRPPSAGRVVRSGSVGYVRQSSDSSGRASGPGAPEDPPDGPEHATVAGALGLSRRLARLDRVLAGQGAPADVDAVGGDWDLRERVRAVLDRFGLGHLELERTMASLSGGEATRVRLVRPVLSSPRILVLDEPTNDLDGESRRALASFLEEWEGGLLVVSHDRTVLEGVDRIVELSTLGLREYGGGWSLYREIRDRERAAARAAVAQARAARRRTEEAVREERERRARRQARGRRSRGTGSQPPVVLEGRRERSQGTARRGGETEERLLASAAEREAEARARLEERAALRVELDPTGLAARKEVLRMEAVDYRPPGSAGLLLEGVTLRLRGPERVSVTGPNGSGKTTLLRLAMGLLRPHGGRVELGLESREVAYLDQRAAILGRARTVLAAFRAAHPGVSETRARHALARFLFPDEAALAPVDTLSGGERMRAALACVVGGSRPPGFLLLDEPTNHLDLESLETVEEAVAAYDGALLVVSHDPRFLEAVGVERTVSLG